MTMQGSDAAPLRLRVFAANLPGALLLLEQRALAFGDRTKSLLAGNRLEVLVEVPRAFRFRRALHLADIDRAHDPSIVADLGGRRRHRVLDRPLVHPLSHPPGL